MLKALLKLFFALLAFVLVASYFYNPLKLFSPPALDPHKALEVKVPALRDDVRIVYDRDGIPHIFAQSEEASFFALGFVHARDRLFQLDVTRHAAYGRLSEFFDRDMVSNDRSLRFLSFRLKEQFDSFSSRDKAIAQAYASGVNAGATHAGASAEHVLLRLQFAPFQAIDTLAIIRLQAWNLALDFSDEIAKLRARKLFAEDDSRRELFNYAISSGGVPIVATTRQAQLDKYPVQPVTKFAMTTSGASVNKVDFDFDYPFSPLQGASNSWAVAKELTESGSAVLCNDPHLAHRTPSTMYLVHLEHPQLRVAGASMPGIPAVLIGFGRDVAWGLTTSYVDTQDVVELEMVDATHYRFNGKTVELEARDELFRKGRGADAEVIKETWFNSAVGPVLPSSIVDAGDAKLALLWAAFDATGRHGDVFSGLHDLARVKRPNELDAAVEKLTLPAQSMVFAFSSGEVAYRLAASIPVRVRATGSSLRPRILKTDADAFIRYLKPFERPQLTNPATGYVVAANQRVVDNSHPLAMLIGESAAEPYRAQRIHERLRELTSGAFKPTFEELAQIQMDETSVMARDLSPALAPFCDVEMAPTFCVEASTFDGVFNRMSTRALPFVTLRDALLDVVLEQSFSQGDAREAAGSLKMRVAYELTVSKKSATPFDNFLQVAVLKLGGIQPLKALVTQRAVDNFRARVREEDSAFWGAVHYLRFEGPLAKIPVLGLFFKSEKFQTAGHGTAPRADAGLPVKSGAVLRFAIELTSPPRAKMILDYGNSGDYASPHLSDMHAKWDKGRFIDFVVESREIESNMEGTISLLRQ